MRLDNVLDGEGCSRPMDIHWSPHPLIPLKPFKSSSGLVPAIISFLTMGYFVGSLTFLAFVHNQQCWPV